jgi:lysophospholipase L1-like esterase
VVLYICKNKPPLPYRSYFLALLGINLLILLCVAIFLLARHDTFAQIIRRVKNGPADRWETERRKFALYNRNMKPGAVLMLGNSLTEQAEWAELTGDPRVVNRGISGETVDRMLERAPDLFNPKPARVCIMAGINDLVYYRRPLAQVQMRYDSLIDAFLSQGIPVVLFSTLPTHFDPDVNNRVKKLNLHLKARAAARHDSLLVFADLWPTMSEGGKLRRDISLDGIHLNEKGYAAWAAVLAQYLPKQAFAKPELEQEPTPSNP